MDPLVIRPARRADVPGLARAWRDAGRFAAETDPVAFQAPAEAGLGYRRRGLTLRKPLVASEHTTASAPTNRNR